jgi:hypothetical protein
MADKPEVWLRGPVEGFDPLVMPVVHSLLQAVEDIEQLAGSVPADLVWQTPGGAASIGFHVRHLGGALDRLFTYARGEALNDVQKTALRAEGAAGEPPATLASVVADVKEQVDGALAQLRRLTAVDLMQPRAVGRAALPTNTLGLLFHAAEHCTRHAGQAITTSRILTAKA